jgi:uncharacterized membrane protein YuzA (DUF378 family)
MMEWTDLFFAICAIAAINWGLGLLKINAVELITPEEIKPLRMIREPAYFVIGLSGLAVLIILISKATRKQ